MPTLKTFAEEAAGLSKEAKDSIDDLGRSAERKFDEARDETGDKLHAAASSVRMAGRKGSKTIGNLATDTADRLDATASYVENAELGDVVTGVRRFARKHVTGSLIAAVAIGFLAGSAIRGMTHSCAKASEGA